MAHQALNNDHRVSPEDLRKQLDSLHCSPDAQKLQELSLQARASPVPMEYANLSSSEEIAGKFADIYKNDWRTASQALRAKWSQDKVIYILMRILRCGYEFCQETAERQLESLVQGAERVILTPLPHDNDQVLDDQDADQLHSARRYLQLYRKTASPLSVQVLEQNFIAEKIPSIFNLEDMDQDVHNYIRASITLLWTMCVQTPPLSIHWQAKGEPVSLKHFNVTEGKGKTVDWTLWPAVVAKEGHVLCKGVVLPI